MTRSLRVAIPLTLILVIFLTFIACTSEPTKTNRGAGNEVGQVEVASPPVLPGTPPQCEPTWTPANRAANLTQHYSDANNGNTHDPDVDAQREKAFKVTFEVEQNLVVVKVRGKIASKEQGASVKPQFQRLLNRLEWYLKKGCADKISFESSAGVAGFEWILCESPNVPCPGGTCAPDISQCPMMMDAGTGNSNANSNSNSKSNSNSNGNSNTRSNENRNTGSGGRSGP